MKLVTKLDSNLKKKEVTTYGELWVELGKVRFPECELLHVQSTELTTSVTVETHYRDCSFFHLQPRPLLHPANADLIFPSPLCRISLDAYVLPRSQD